MVFVRRIKATDLKAFLHDLLCFHRGGQGDCGFVEVLLYNFVPVTCDVPMLFFLYLLLLFLLLLHVFLFAEFLHAFLLVILLQHVVCRGEHGATSGEHCTERYAKKIVKLCTNEIISSKITQQYPRAAEKERRECFCVCVCVYVCVCEREREREGERG